MKTYQGTFRNLIVWREAKELAKKIYQVANEFPSDEKHGLSSQMKRAEVSVMSNIAEGNQREGKKDLLHFFNIAYSSLAELDSQSELAYELGYTKEEDYKRLVELINKEGYLLRKFIDSKKYPNNPKSPKFPSSPKNPNNLNSPTQKGFSLVELLVTVTIIAILATAATVGFRYLGDTLRTKQAGGVIVDTIKELELELLQNYYKKSTLYFLPDYLVVVSEPEEVALEMTWNGMNGDCGEIKIKDSGNFTKTNEEGAVIAIESVTATDLAPDTKCVDFRDSEDREWHYQIISGSEKSALIRFIHFNIDRDNPSGITLATSDSGDSVSDYKLELSAPYATKQKYKHDAVTDESIDLEIRNSDDQTKEMITIN